MLITKEQVARIETYAAQASACGLGLEVEIEQDKNEASAGTITGLFISDEDHPDGEGVATWVFERMMALTPKGTPKRKGKSDVES